MKTYIKGILSIIFITALLLVIALPDEVSASEAVNYCNSGCEDSHATDYVEGQTIKWEKEIVVEVSSEKDFLLYPKNPNYRYTFIITSPSLSRAVCYMCGMSTMGTVRYLNQSSVAARMCPTNNWGNDIFAGWDNLAYERCTACGYRSDTWLSRVTYTAQCRNGDSHWSGADWEVKYEYTQNNGYNLHQSLRWWTQYSML